MPSETDICIVRLHGQHLSVSDGSRAIPRTCATALGEQDRWRVESAGTWGMDGQPASANAELVMRQRNIRLDGHIARTVTAELLREADILVVMTRSHHDALAAEFPETREKFTLSAH